MATGKHLKSESLPSVRFRDQMSICQKPAFLYIQAMRITTLSLIIAVLVLGLMSCGGETTPESRLDKMRRLVDDGKFEDALEEIPLLKNAIPTDSAFLMLAGRTYLGLNMPDSAHACAKQFTALYPTRLDGYHFLYQTSELTEDYDAEIWAISQLGYLENNRPKYYYEIARLNFLRGEYGQSMRTCEMIFKTDPENPDALFIYSNCLATIGKIDSAIAIMEKLNRRNPDKIEVLSNLGSFLVNKRDYEKAAVHFKRLTSLYPDYIPGWYGLGNVLITTGDTNGAKNAYMQVYTRDSTFLDIDSIMHSLDPLRF